MVIPAVLVAAGVVALVACTTGAGERGGRSLPADCRAPVLYVALGDSTVEGIGATSRSRNYVSRIHARLRAIYPAARVENLGVGGAVSADVLHRQVDRAVELRPDLVTLSVGPNDITGGVPVDAFARNIERILKRLTTSTTALVVANLLPDLAVTPRFVASAATKSPLKFRVAPSRMRAMASGNGSPAARMRGMTSMRQASAWPIWPWPKWTAA